MSFKETLAARVIDAGGKLTVRSALNPILWLCAIISIPCVILIPFFKTFQGFLFALAASPVFAAILGFFILLIFDRDKLQSEEYQLRKHTLELMQQKGQALPSPIANVNVIPPPEQEKLVEGGDK